MRADRLVATLLLLQARGSVTAAEVAEELEISQRTARRDLEALAMSGVPLYSRAGRGGGWSLIGGATTDLSGLTASEARALFLVAGPSSSASPEVKAALRKLVQALPEPFRADAEAASGAVVVDASAWGADRSSESVPHLAELEAAVLDKKQIRLIYAGADRARSDRVVHPLGLVSKRGVWYLIGDTDAGMRTFRVSRVVQVEQLDDAAIRPDDFDLERAWSEVTSRMQSHRRGVTVSAAIDPTALGIVRGLFGANVALAGSAEDGWVEATFSLASVEAAVGQLAGFGVLMRVAGPPEVIDGMARVGRELLDSYGDRV